MVHKTMPPLGWLAPTTIRMGFEMNEASYKARILNAQLHFIITGRFKKRIKKRLPRKQLKIRNNDNRN